MGRKCLVIAFPRTAKLNIEFCLGSYNVSPQGLFNLCAGAERLAYAAVQPSNLPAQVILGGEFEKQVRLARRMSEHATQSLLVLCVQKKNRCQFNWQYFVIVWPDVRRLSFQPRMKRVTRRTASQKPFGA
jgi:hypothetical protein